MTIMETFKKYSQIALSVAVLAAGISVSYALVAHAQTSGTNVVTAGGSATSTLVSPAELQYPIAALGNCSGVSACRDYCNNPQNQSACLAFAEQNHLMNQNQIQRAQQLLTLIQSGQTPGKCDSAQSCRAYCGDPAHATECLNFAEQHGFVGQSQANAIRQNGGKGPGGCDSAEACAAFCNNSQNQTACLDFAKQNGIISNQEANDIQEGAAGLRIGLQQFPGQVVSCLKNQLGDNAVGELESGQITPNASTSAAVNSCFTAFKSQIQNRFQNMFQNASGTVEACLQGIGSSTIAALKQGDLRAVGPQVGERVRECLQGDQNQEMEQNAGSSTRNQERNLEQEMNRVMQNLPGDVMGRLQNLPPQVKNCVEPYLAMNPSSTDVSSVISRCMQQYGSSTRPAENALMRPANGDGELPFGPAGPNQGGVPPQAPDNSPMMRGGQGN